MVQLVDKELGYNLISSGSSSVCTNYTTICNSPDGAVEAAEEYTQSLLGQSGAPCKSYSSVDEVSSKDDSGDMSFCMAKYSKDVLKMMYMMRSHHMLTDVILDVEKEQFHVHKVVLSAASPYFKAMFTGGLKESEMSRVSLQGICPMAMGRMIYFMYTGNIRVTEVTVCQLLPAATMFQVPYVVDACCAFLERQLDPTNAIGISSFAEQHGCESLKQKANQFIERNFTQICQEEEFLQLSAIQLIGLIRKDELNVQGEREVYNAVLNWVKYDEDNRHPRMEHILYAVRCQLLPPSFLNDQMKNCEVLRRAPNCRRYLEEIFKDLTLHKRPEVKERRPNTTRMIFVAGGYLRGSLDVVEAFNVDDKTWTTLPPLRVPRSGLGAAFLKGNFYAVGGRNNTPGASFDSDWVDRYNPLNEQWRPCSPMTVPRHRSGVAVMDELLYAVGGSAGSEYHSSVEYFDPEEDRWTLVQPMHSKRFGVGVAVVNRLLYAIGGFDGNDRLASMECYHPENNAWTTLPSMKLGRSGAGVVALNQHIYVVGGFDGQNHLSSVERFDTEQLVWEMVAEIRTPRSALSLTVLDGKLFAMGGFDGQVFLTNVEVYDPAKNEWEDGTPLTSGRSGHASAVIYQPAVPSGTHQEPVTVTTGNNKPEVVKDEAMVMENRSQGSSRGNNDSHGQFNGGGGGGGTGNSRPASQPAVEAMNRMSLSMETESPRPQLFSTSSMDPSNRSVIRPPIDQRVNGANPLRGNLIDINLLKNMCDNTDQPRPAQQSSSNGRNFSPMRSGGGGVGVGNSHGQLQVVNLESLIEPGPSSRNLFSPPSVNQGMFLPSPPIRIAKKREAAGSIPSTPPSDSEFKPKSNGHPAAVPQAAPPFGGVKTFLPVVDFQNQRKYRRKINPMPVRHPSYCSPEPMPTLPPREEPVVRHHPPPPPAPSSPSCMGRCKTMNKIREVVKQKLFSPSMLMSVSGSSSSSNGDGGVGGVGAAAGSSYQEKLKLDRSNLIKNRRSVLSNADDEDSSSDNMDEGRFE